MEPITPSPVAERAIRDLTAWNKIFEESRNRQHAINERVLTESFEDVDDFLEALNEYGQSEGLTPAQKAVKELNNWCEKADKIINIRKAEKDKSANENKK